MKKYIILLILLIPTQAIADPYYVFIEKKGKVDIGEEAGHSAKGDIVSILPATPQYEPTVSDLNNLQVITVDLEKSDIELLLQENIGTVLVNKSGKVKKTEYDAWLLNNTTYFTNFSVISLIDDGEDWIVDFTYEKQDVVEFRKNKVDFEKLNLDTQKKNVDKTEFFKKVIDKSAVVVVP